MNLADHIKSNCGGLPHDRITITQLSDFKLAAIDQAVLFIFATWSSAAAMSFKFLCDALAKNPETRFPVMVLSADGFDFNVFKMTLGELPQGKGEAFWIKHGQIISRDCGYTTNDTELFRERIETLTSNT